MIDKDAVEFSRNYAGLWRSRLLPGNSNPREVGFARQWVEENDLERRPHLLDTLLDTRPHDLRGFKTGPRPKVSDRDKAVAATVIQWLGSNVGMCFLSQAIRRSPEAVRYLKADLKGYNHDGTPMK